MKLFVPALIIFLLGFVGLSIGIIFGRKGISSGCSSGEGKLADLQCTCGGSKSIDGAGTSCNNVAIEVVCPDEDPEQYQHLLKQLEKTRQE